MSIKDTIAAIRKEAGITQEEMARRLYVTRQAVSRWETGETTPGIDMVKLICVTFGVPLERFFDMPMSHTVSVAACLFRMKKCMAPRQMDRKVPIFASTAMTRAILRQKV